MKHAARMAALALATLALAGAALADEAQFNGTLAGPGAVGWHPVVMHAGHRYRITAMTRDGAARLNVRLSLGSAVVKEKLGEGSEVRLGFQAPLSGIYWLRVQSAAGQGEYELAVDER